MFIMVIDVLASFVAVFTGAFYWLLSVMAKGEIDYSALRVCRGIFLVLLIYAIARIILHSPFKYPYFTHKFNVSGKRQPDIEDYIDRFIIDDHFPELYEHQKKIREWKSRCKKKAAKSFLWPLRERQLKRCIDDEHAYRFIFVRRQTRYRQRNYKKTAYSVYFNDGGKECSYKWLLDRYKQLEDINFEKPLREYNAYNQRKMMTPELRRRVMERDNYTCQVCGKYMPDEVGLHIDHIIPISKGGKSVESNLQVLCSKHNLSKSNKLQGEK